MIDVSTERASLDVIGSVALKSQEEVNAAHTVKLWAWGVVGCAFALPMVMGSLNLIQTSAAYAVGQLLGWFALLMAVTVIVTSRALPMTRARAALCAAICVLGFSAWTVYQDWAETTRVKRSLSELLDVVAPSDKSVAAGASPAPAASVPAADAATYLRGMTALIQSNQVEMQRIRSAMSDIEVDSMLTPTTLVDAGKVQEAQAKVRTLRGLVMEISNQVDSYLAKADHYLRTAPASDADRAQALAGYASSAADSKKLYADYIRVELRVLDDLDAVLNFASTRNGSFQMGGGKLLFANQADLDRYNALLARMTTDTAQEDAVVQRIQDMDAKGRANAQAMRSTLLK